MKPKFTAVEITETAVLSSRLAASIGGKVTRNEARKVHRVKCEIDRSVFFSQTKYTSLRSAQNAADRFNKKMEQQ